MAILVSAHRLEKAFASRMIFRSLTFGVESGDRIGLIGPNGAGKSTLMKILAGQSDVDGGDLSFGRGIRVAYLAQDPQFNDTETVREALYAAVEDPYDPDQLSRIDTLISKLDLNRPDVNEDSVVKSLSGGWKKRVALARELVRNPDLLLLDEPTNHLDVEAIHWLEEFLSTAPFATMTVTHDRLFLQRVANRIFDLDPRYPEGLLVVKGEYVEYLTVRDELLRGQERREVVLKNTLRRETEWLRRGAKARTTKQTARIKRAGALDEEVEDLETRNAKKRLQLDFQESARNPHKLIEAIGLKKTFPGPNGEPRTLFEDLNFIITPKTRLGLLGPNGAGKSTLIRCLLGMEPTDAGQVKRAEKLSVGYFEQHRETLDPKKTVLKNILDEGDYVEFRGQPVFARSYLDRFLFRTEQHDMPVEKLSGGEKARLRVAQMMLKPSNILVLDEPTNDLDLATMAVLEETLAEFNGAVILVTHDRYFLDQVSNRILAFEVDEHGDPELLEFAAFSQWEEWKDAHEAKLKAAARQAKKPKPAAATPGQPAAPAKKKRKLNFNEQRELDTMEATIQGAEQRLAHLQTEASNPANLSKASKLSEIFAEITT
ncbi:MAG: ABC-F family ATP-binding cassette domain-containing protein, partial [Bdellovibrionota bacterium]